MELPFFSAHKRRKQFGKFFNEVKLRRHNDDDILSAARKEQLDALLDELAATPRGGEAAALSSGRDRFRRILPPPSQRWLRDLLDLLLVVGAVAFGIRALYFQPFRIPTSSMQPTLYGIHYLDRENATNPLLGKLPGLLNWLLFSASEAKAVVKSPGAFDYTSIRPVGNAFSDATSFRIGEESYRLPGDVRKVVDYTRLAPGTRYQAGDVLADGFVSLGDHLFVERFSLYLTPLKRGEIVVFTTDGLRAYDKNLSEQSGFFFIKRLVGLPGDTLKIVDNQLWVRPKGEAQFRRIQEIAPAFEKLYSGKGGYQGHLNYMGEILSSPGVEFVVPEDAYFMMGDNSRFSLDSRYFGPVPRRNLVGKAWVIFWPISRRWGWADRQPPVDAPTGEAGPYTFEVMSRQ